MQLTVLVLAVLVCSACPVVQGPHGGSVMPGTKPLARITQGARFLFPLEPVDTLTWDVPDSNGYLGSPQYAWTAEWEPGLGKRGTVPHALWLVTYWRPGGPRRGSVALMVRDWSGSDYRRPHHTVA
jgi:hypothetical protein